MHRAMNQSNEHYFTRTCTIHVVSQVNGTRRPKYNYWELPWGIDSSSETLQPCVFDSPSDTLNARISFFPFTFLALATVNHNKISTVIIQTRTKHDRNCISNTCGLPAYWVLPFSIAESLGRIFRLSTFFFFCFICLSIAVLNKELYITVYPPVFLLTALKTLTQIQTLQTRENDALVAAPSRNPLIWSQARLFYELPGQYSRLIVLLLTCVSSFHR